MTLASQAQAAAESELRLLKEELVRVRAEMEKIRQSQEAEKAESAKATQRLIAAKRATKSAQASTSKATSNESGDAEKAAEDALQKATKSAALLRSVVQKSKGEVSLLTKITTKLSKSSAAPKVEKEDDTSELQAELLEKIQAAVLSRTMIEEKLEEMKLELAELELQIDEATEARAKNAMEKPLDRAAEYQQALRVLHMASNQQVQEIEARIKELDRDANNPVKLKQDQENLMRKQSHLYEHIADLETEATELGSVTKAGDELQELRNGIVAEMRQELESCDERSKQLELLIKRLEEERLKICKTADAESTKAAELLQVVFQLTHGEDASGGTQTLGAAPSFARTAAGILRHQLAELDLDTARSQVDAFNSCIPRTWVAKSGTAVTGTAGTAMAKASSRVAAAAAAERLLCRLEALAERAASSSSESNRAECCIVGVASWRSAALLASAVDGGLHSGKDDASVESSFSSMEQKLQTLVKNSWPSLPPAVEVQKILGDLPKADGFEKSRRADAFTLRRLGAAFQFAGQEAKLSGSDSVESSDLKTTGELDLDALALRIGDLATKLIDYGSIADASEGEKDKTVQEALALPDELQKVVEGFEASLGDSTECISSSSVTLLKSSAKGLLKALEPLRTKLTAMASSRRSKAKGKRSGAAPKWAFCFADVQKEIDGIFDAELQVFEAKRRLEEQKKALEAAEAQFNKAAIRRASLQDELKIVLDKQSKGEALNLEERKLRQEAKELAASQAALGREFDKARGLREDQERAKGDSEKKLEALEQELENMRRKPKQDGRATAQELATLRHSQLQSARDLYALQVSGIHQLKPLLPAAAGTVPRSDGKDAAKTRALESCVGKYATLKQNLLTEWSHVQVCKLQSAESSNTKTAADFQSEQVSRMQNLQLKLLELQSATTSIPDVQVSSAAEAEAGVSATSPTNEQKGKPLVKLKVDVRCPGWVETSNVSGAPASLSATLPQLQELHSAAAA
eukprot:TRINITY_DN1748_c0_g2_i1.p1 TRINITY_DN1748_c0_g2~~TRINITY_DN1748_c0_g2_i1.p1  ORF type:complete len:984 (+),score=270.43 TRINITY_DN1748_c0_g2_i1:228-3179(+)